MRAAITTPLYFDTVDAPSPVDASQTVKYGLRSATIQAYGRSGLRTPMAQFFGIVQGGLINARHVFRGLNRPMCYEENMEADQTILVYSWTPSADYEYVGRVLSEYALVEMKPIAGKVFVTLVREEKIKEGDDNQTEGTIEKWNWVREDPELPGAPVDWKVRYAKKIWSR